MPAISSTLLSVENLFAFCLAASRANGPADPEAKASFPPHVLDLAHAAQEEAFQCIMRKAELADSEIDRSAVFVYSLLNLPAIFTSVMIAKNYFSPNSGGPSEEFAMAFTALEARCRCILYNALGALKEQALADMRAKS